mgnify:CR=1 FL=1
MIEKKFTKTGKEKKWVCPNPKCGAVHRSDFVSHGGNGRCRKCGIGQLANPIPRKKRRFMKKKKTTSKKKTATTAAKKKKTGGGKGSKREKGAPPKLAFKRNKDGVGLYQRWVEIFVENEKLAKPLTDDQISDIMKKEFPDHKTKDFDHPQRARSKYNRGFFHGGEPPKLRSNRYDSEGNKANPKFSGHKGVKLEELDGTPPKSERKKYPRKKKAIAKKKATTKKKTTKKSSRSRKKSKKS